MVGTAGGAVVRVDSGSGRCLPNQAARRSGPGRFTQAALGNQSIGTSLTHDIPALQTKADVVDDPGLWRGKSGQKSVGTLTKTSPTGRRGVAKEVTRTEPAGVDGRTERCSRDNQNPLRTFTKAVLGENLSFSKDASFAYVQEV